MSRFCPEVYTNNNPSNTILITSSIAHFYFLCATLATTIAMTSILPTTNGPYPTTHLALNVCEALRRPSLCEARYVKDEDELVHLAYGLFSGKELPAVMRLELRKKKH